MVSNTGGHTQEMPQVFLEEKLTLSIVIKLNVVYIDKFDVGSSTKNELQENKLCKQSCPAQPSSNGTLTPPFLLNLVTVLDRLDHRSTADNLWLHHGAFPSSNYFVGLNFY